jgi:hypothetical protein
MVNLQKTFLIYMLAAFLVISGTLLPGATALAGCDTSYRHGEEPSAGLMLVDAVLIRPLTFVASVAGAAIWVVTLPFTLMGGNTDEAGDILVADPWCYTIDRPLGYMEKVP